MSNEKPEKTPFSFGGMIRLGLILALYATVAAVALAFVYNGTKDIIAENRQRELENALRVLFPGADEFEVIFDVFSPDPAVSFQEGGSFAVKQEGELIGLAIRTSRFSYSGPIIILTGVGVDNRISGVSILENIDTPGLGSNASSPNFFVDRARGIRFYQQFTGKHVSEPFVVGQDVISITAATITARAVATSVKAAGQAAAAWFEAQGGSL